MPLAQMPIIRPEVKGHRGWEAMGGWVAVSTLRQARGTRKTALPLGPSCHFQAVLTQAVAQLWGWKALVTGKDGHDDGMLSRGQEMMPHPRNMAPSRKRGTIRAQDPDMLFLQRPSGWQGGGMGGGETGGPSASSPCTPASPQNQPGRPGPRNLLCVLTQPSARGSYSVSPH